MPAAPQVPPPGSPALKLLNLMTKAHVAAYRATGGRIGGTHKRAPVLLLDHVGRKSGQVRTTPLLYQRDGENLVIVASRGGSDATPAWWLNLKASPVTTVTVGRERRRVQAQQASDDDKARLWPGLVQMFPDYAVYQSRTSRDIPVIVLSPTT
jgi:F420H(2)-dependent quinone reductase